MSIDAHSIRRNEDIAKLRSLEIEFNGALKVRKVAGNPISEVELEIMAPTARSQAYPAEKQLTNNVVIKLPSRYPFDPPSVTVTTPVWNPNIFPSGLVCLGQKWVVTHNLALLTQRLIQILTLDPSVINVDSPANATAAKWYRTLSGNRPSPFPTITLQALKIPPKPKIQWRGL